MLQGMAQVLGLALRSIRVLAAERHLRAEKERQATTAQTRQRLVESLLTIQRAISGRRPRPEIAGPGHSKCPGVGIGDGIQRC